MIKIEMVYNTNMAQKAWCCRIRDIHWLLIMTESKPEPLQHTIASAIETENCPSLSFYQFSFRRYDCRWGSTVGRLLCSTVLLRERARFFYISRPFTSIFAHASDIFPGPEIIPPFSVGGFCARQAFVRWQSSVMCAFARGRA